MELKQRYEFIDLAKGVCIIMIVLYHVSLKFHFRDYDGYLLVRNILLPPFFFLSGMFFSQGSSLRDFIIKRIRTLIVPFVSFYVITVILLPLLLSAINIHSYSNPIGLHYISDIYREKWVMNRALWFLPCLFIIHFLFYVVIAISRKFKTFQLAVVLLLSIVLGLSGFTLSECHLKLPFFADTALTAIPFFSLAWIMKNHMNFLEDKVTCKSFCILIALACITVAYCIEKDVSYVNNRFEGNVLQCYLTGFSLCFFVIFLCKSITKLQPFNYFGMNSLIILVTHRPVLNTLTILCDRLHYSFIVSFLIVCVLTIASMFILIPIINSKFSFLIGRCRTH